MTFEVYRQSKAKPVASTKSTNKERNFFSEYNNLLSDRFLLQSLSRFIMKVKLALTPLSVHRHARLYPGSPYIYIMIVFQHYWVRLKRTSTALFLVVPRPGRVQCGVIISESLAILQVASKTLSHVAPCILLTSSFSPSKVICLNSPKNLSTYQPQKDLDTTLRAQVSNSKKAVMKW